MVMFLNIRKSMINLSHSYFYSFMPKCLMLIYVLIKSPILFWFFIHSSALYSLAYLFISTVPNHMGIITLDSSKQ